MNFDKFVESLQIIQGQQSGPCSVDGLTWRGHWSLDLSTPEGRQRWDLRGPQLTKGVCNGRPQEHERGVSSPGTVLPVAPEGGEAGSREV